ncbi:MAG: DUF2341 domain-containing protein, partial [Promethearchaeota archaeon]
YDFDYYKEITIDHSNVAGSSDLFNFPVLISIMDLDLQDHTQPDGDDIAFYADGKWLDHEIEAFNQTYDETHAQLIAWVRVPILYHDNDTKIHMYYGNSKIGPLENPSDVWNSNYKGVWHLGDGVMNPSSSYYDSTINDNDGKALNSPINDTTSKIDGGVSFDDSNERAVGISHSSSLQFVSNFSISGWFRSTDNDTDVGLIMNKWSGDESKQNYWLGKLNQNDFAFYVDNDSNVLYEWSNLNDGDWHYVVATANSTTLVIYIDGSLVASNSWDGISITGDADLHIGKAVDTIDQEFNGDIDEIHVLDTILDLNWISTEYNNQYNPDNFYSVSSAKQTLPIYYFQYHKDITINHAKVSGSSDLLNFPVLISICDSDLKNHTQPDGDDIAFYYENEWLDHEIELFDNSYNDTHAQLVAWVRVPSLSSSMDTVIKMCYGNSSISSKEFIEGVWNSNYSSVWHLNDDFKDSTINQNDGTNHGSSNTVGQIADAQDFAGYDTDQEITIEPSKTLNPTYITVSAWINPRGQSTGPETGMIVSDYDWTNTTTKIYYLYMHPNNRIYVTVFWDDGITTSDLISQPITLNEWHLVHFTVNSSTLALYIDGVYITPEYPYNATAPITGGIKQYLNTIEIGSEEQMSSCDHEFNGTIDDVRILNTDLSTDWIATEYNNQYNPSTFYTVGTQEANEKTPPTYSNLTESSDPLELGETEVITINVTDPSGINQVLIEYEGANDTMTNIGGDIWQYDSWTPNTVDNYTYIIWMEDNYHNWNSTMGTIEVIDTTPPTYSNLLESADPLKLGQNETITIKVYDSPGSGVNQVLLEYESSNHTMGFIGGNTWSWSKWKPSSPIIYPYTIYMQDMENNWNMTSGDITVIVSYAPFIENLTVSEDPLELGNDIIITVDVYDIETNVSTVLIELDGINRTMSNISGNTYEYIWYSSEYIESGYSVGLPLNVNFKIYANDTDNNWNSLSSSFEIVDTTPPAFSALIESDNPLEIGNIEIITINCTDLAGINEVKIEFEGGNHSMINTVGNTWEYDSWLPENTGNFTYIIWCEDNSTNWNKIVGYILVQDTIFPVFSDLSESSNPTEIGTPLFISINATDSSGIKQVLIEYEGVNNTMTWFGGDVWQYNDWDQKIAGNYSYKIYIEDYNNHINSTNTLFMVFQDTTSPGFSDLSESSNPTEIGTPLLISIKATDLSGINEVLIEYEGVNNTMTWFGGDLWQYNDWDQKIAGNYSYKIYIQDYNNLTNSTNTLFMVFQDTTSPGFSDLTESSNPLQLGDNETITFNAYDLSGINQVLIEIGGQNHSMINIYGITWQYNSWNPTSIGIKNYTIYIEDNNQNWNITIGSITVQDTKPPNKPELTISWSGKANDIITFIWGRGSDPSGILYYILIIDNEDNFTDTPGYVYKFNITNTGNESIYYELPEILPPGQYWYFLAQIDGVGLQSEYDSGTFTVINPPSNNDFMIFIIIGLIISIIIGSLIAAIVVRKKMQKKVTPYIKKIPLKIIIPHLTKISTTALELAKKDFQVKIFEKEQVLAISDEEFIDEDNLEIKVNEIKNLGEKLFNEGAYLEAEKQFELGKEFLLKHGKEEDAKLFSELSSGIKGLIEEREKRLEILEQVKIEGDSVKIFDLYYDILEISKKLRDLDGENMYKSELIQFFQTNKFKLIDIKRHIFYLEQEADSLISNNFFEKAAHLYEKCENLSDFLVQLGKEEETKNIRKFKNKREECLKKILDK